MVWRKNENSRNIFLIEFSSGVIEYWIMLMVKRNRKWKSLSDHNINALFMDCSMFLILIFTKKRRSWFSNFYVFLVLIIREILFKVEEVNLNSTSLSISINCTCNYMVVTMCGSDWLGPSWVIHPSHISHSYMMGWHRNSRAVNIEIMNNHISLIIQVDISSDHEHI